MMLRRKSPGQEHRIHGQLRICPQFHRRAGWTNRRRHWRSRNRLPAVYRKLQGESGSADRRISTIDIEGKIIQGALRIPAGERGSRRAHEVPEWNEGLVRGTARTHRKTPAV